MTKFAVLIAAPALLALAACGATETDNSNGAEDFAARINGSGPKPEATVAPTVAQPLEGAAPGAYAPGTATDPQSSNCAATAMGAFLGRQADEANRAAIMVAAAGASEVRFVQPGSDYIRPDPTSSRLNLMLDNLGIIRDARCG